MIVHEQIENPHVLFLCDEDSRHFLWFCERYPVFVRVRCGLKDEKNRFLVRRAVKELSWKRKIEIIYNAVPSYYG